MSKSYSFIAFLETKEDYNNFSAEKLSTKFLNYKKNAFADRNFELSSHLVWHV